MKTKIVVLLSCILVLFTGCIDNNNNLPQKSFTDTKWKLIGFVDGQTELLKKPENNLSILYWISFNADHTLFVKSSANELVGTWAADFDLSTIQIVILGGTKIYEGTEGRLYVESLEKSHSFSVTDKELRLYYGDKSDYLLFSNTILKDTKWKLAGLMDVETNVLKELEPKDCEQCYTLTFDTDSTGIARSIANDIWVNLLESPIFGIMTEVYDNMNGDVEVFYEAIEKVNSYLCKDDELKFFYNNSKKYLLYKRLLQ